MSIRRGLKACRGLYAGSKEVGLFLTNGSTVSDSGCRSREAPEGVGSRSGRYPCLAQRLPTNQRAREREERLVNVGPLLIPHAQAAKLAEPRECAFHNPALPAQSTPMRGATHGEPRHDAPRPQSTPNRRCVVAAIPENTSRPLPRSLPCAVQWGNRIHQRQRFLRVVPVRTGRRTASGTPRPSQIR